MATRTIYDEIEKEFLEEQTSKINRAIKILKGIENEIEDNLEEIEKRIKELRKL